MKCVIKIAFPSGVEGEVEAEIYGQYAVHPPIVHYPDNGEIGAPEGEPSWFDITHIQSKSVLHRERFITHARRIARALKKQLDLDAAYQSGEQDKVQGEFRAIINKARG